MDMCHIKIKTVILTPLMILCVFLAGCGPMDSLFNSAGNYRINVQINDIPLDELSFVRSSDKVCPYFEHSVSKDPDITSLMVYLRDPAGEIAGWKVIYKLDEKAVIDPAPEKIDEEAAENENDSSDDKDTDSSNEDQNEIESEDENDNGNESNNDDDDTLPSEAKKSDPPAKDALQIPNQYENGDELVIYVKSFNNLPLFPIPENLPMGSYVIVSLVMNNDNVLQKIERSFFYLGNVDFSYNGIHANLPGIAESNQLIPAGTVIMLEADLKFDGKLDPFIEWYDGKKKIAEGKVSDGTGKIFWKAPEESGFYSIRTVIFPIENKKNLSGYQKELTLLVSGKPISIHLIDENIPYKHNAIHNSALINWYTFESNLNDSRKLSGAEQADAEKTEDRALKHAKNKPVWKAANGTYGAATGNDNIISAQKILFSEKEHGNWQALFRLKPENDGGILSVQFGKSNYAYIHLYIEKSNLFLTLTSASDTVTQTYSLNRPVSEDTAPAANDLSASETSPQEAQETARSDTSPETAVAAPAAAAEETAEYAGSLLANNAPQVNAMWGGDGSFITAGILFNIQPGALSARLNILGDSIGNELDGKPVILETEMKNEFLIMLGFLPENKRPINQAAGSTEDASGQSAFVRHEFTALWDEFALYRMP